MGTASGCSWHQWLGQRRVRHCVAGWVSNSSSAQQRPCLRELGATSGTPEAVVTYLGTTARQDVQEEAVDELGGRQGDVVQLAGCGCRDSEK